MAVVTQHGRTVSQSLGREEWPRRLWTAAFTISHLTSDSPYSLSCDCFLSSGVLSPQPTALGQLCA